MKRFEVVFNIPSPYRLHMLRELHRQLTVRGIDFHVHFMARGHKERPKSWLNPEIDFPHTYWKDYGFGQHHFNPGLVWYILRNPPEWLLAGSPYDTFTCILILLLAKIPVKIVGAEGNTKTPGRLGGVIGWLKRKIYATAKYASVPGKDAAEYFALHQARTKARMPRPVIMPNLVDERRFRPRREWSEDQINATRLELGVEAGTRLCIIPARFDPVKGLLEFVDVLSAKDCEGWRFAVFGHGPLREAFESRVAQKDMSQLFRIVESVPYDDMPRFYAASDLMLLPSLQDMNPLSVPEALFSGLPIALSDQAGNVEEGVSEGLNGWRLPVKNANRFGEVLRDVFSSSIDRLRQMGRVSLEKNAKFWATKDAVRNYLDVIVGVKEDLAERLSNDGDSRWHGEEMG